MSENDNTLIFTPSVAASLVPETHVEYSPNLCAAGAQYVTVTANIEPVTSGAFSFKHTLEPSVALQSDIQICIPELEITFIVPPLTSGEEQTHFQRIFGEKTPVHNVSMRNLMSCVNNLTVQIGNTPITISNVSEVFDVMSRFTSAVKYHNYKPDASPHYLYKNSNKMIHSVSASDNMHITRGIPSKGVFNIQSDISERTCKFHGSTFDKLANSATTATVKLIDVMTFIPSELFSYYGDADTPSFFGGGNLMISFDIRENFTDLLVVIPTDNLSDDSASIKKLSSPVLATSVNSFKAHRSRCYITISTPNPLLASMIPSQSSGVISHMSFNKVDVDPAASYTVKNKHTVTNFTIPQRSVNEVPSKIGVYIQRDTRRLPLAERMCTSRTLARMESINIDFSGSKTSIDEADKIHGLAVKNGLIQSLYESKFLTGNLLAMDTSVNLSVNKTLVPGQKHPVLISAAGQFSTITTEVEATDSKGNIHILDTDISADKTYDVFFITETPCMLRYDPKRGREIIQGMEIGDEAFIAGSVTRNAPTEGKYRPHGGLFSWLKRGINTVSKWVPTVVNGVTNNKDLLTNVAKTVEGLTQGGKIAASMRLNGGSGYGGNAISFKT